MALAVEMDAVVMAVAAEESMGGEVWIRAEVVALTAAAAGPQPQRETLDVLDAVPKQPREDVCSAMKGPVVASRLLITFCVVLASSCDRSPLVAPIASTISVYSSETDLRPGETAEVSALVVEEAGTLVHDGTVVRFFATLGSVDPVQVKTRDGVATTTFTAGSTIGTAQITATSGSAIPGPDQPNVVEIAIE